MRQVWLWELGVVWFFQAAPGAALPKQLAAVAVQTQLLLCCHNHSGCTNSPSPARGAATATALAFGVSWKAAAALTHTAGLEACAKSSWQCLVQWGLSGQLPARLTPSKAVACSRGATAMAAVSICGLSCVFYWRSGAAGSHLCSSMTQGAADALCRRSDGTAPAAAAMVQFSENAVGGWQYGAGRNRLHPQLHSRQQLATQSGCCCSEQRSSSSCQGQLAFFSALSCNSRVIIRWQLLVAVLQLQDSTSCSPSHLQHSCWVVPTALWMFCGVVCLEVWCIVLGHVQKCDGGLCVHCDMFVSSDCWAVPLSGQGDIWVLPGFLLESAHCPAHKHIACPCLTHVYSMSSWMQLALTTARQSNVHPGPCQKAHRLRCQAQGNGSPHRHIPTSENPQYSLNCPLLPSSYYPAAAAAACPLCGLPLTFLLQCCGSGEAGPVCSAQVPLDH